MTDERTLLEQAARCRRIARICTSAAIARKFEAIARDYEEHARLLRGPDGGGRNQPPVELREPRVADFKAGDAEPQPQLRVAAAR